MSTPKFESIDLGDEVIRIGNLDLTFADAIPLGKVSPAHACKICSSTEQIYFLRSKDSTMPLCEVCKAELIKELEARDSY